VRRALERVGPASHEFRALRDAIAGGVLEREHLAARPPDAASLGVCPYKGWRGTRPPTRRSEVHSV
jgi:hypothetical protein